MSSSETFAPMAGMCRVLAPMLAIASAAEAAMAPSQPPTPVPLPTGEVAAGSRIGGVGVPFNLPLRISGRHIVDANGSQVRLQCVNWYGAHLKQMVMGGLDKRPLDELSALIASSGFNCVRLPFNLDMIFRADMPVPEPNVSLAANPDLKSLSPLAIFDKTVTSLTNQGLLVILNNHVSSAGWCCSISDGEGLWYTVDYPQDMWLESMTFMAARYRNNSLVAGFDLRNEIRQSDLGTPTWGDGNLKTDWSIAATKGAQNVLAEDPDMVIFVSGLDFSQYLCDVPRNPIHLLPGLSGRLAYTSHYYSWDASVGPEASEVMHWLQVALGILCGLLTLLLLLACLLPQRSDWASWRLLRLLACDCRREPQPSIRRPCALLVTAIVFACLSCGFALWPEPDCSSSAVMAAMWPFSSLVALTCGVLSLVLGLHWLLLSLRIFRCVATGQEADAQSDPAEAVEALPGEERSSPTAHEEGAQTPGGGQRHLGKGASHFGRGASLFTSKAPASPARARGVLRSRLFLAVVLVASLLSAIIYCWKQLTTYRRFARKLDRDWGFLLEGGAADGRPGASGPVPVWLGEFGTDADIAYWRNTLRYISERDVGWAYWAFNGEKYSVGHVPEPYGLFRRDWITVRQTWKLEELQELISPRAGAVRLTR